MDLSRNLWFFSWSIYFISHQFNVLDLSNYATKVDLKNATGVDTSKFAKKVDLANLKSDIDKLDIDKLKKMCQTV